MSGANLSLVSIIRMRAKGCPVPLIVDTYCSLIHWGYDVAVRDVEAYYVANRHDVTIEDPHNFLARIKDSLDLRDDSDKAEILER